MGLKDAVKHVYCRLPWLRRSFLRKLALFIVFILFCNAFVHYGKPAKQSRKLLHGSLLGAALVQQRNDDKVMAIITELLKLLTVAEQETGLTAPCHQDDSLPRSLPAGVKHLLAFCVHDSEDLMPHNLISLIQLLLSTPREDVFVSVFESASVDSTVRWVKILAKVLALLDVPHRIRAGGPQERVTQKWKGGRIQFLASVRNAALTPLWPASPKEIDEWRNYFFSNTLPESLAWPADQIIYFNDVFFCDQDVIRLSHVEGNMTCSTDWTHYVLKDRKLNSVSNNTLANLERAVNQDLGTVQPLPSAQHWQWHSFPAIPQDFAGQRCAIYDHWVARDIMGKKINVWTPYTSDTYTADLAAAGRPFPVQCCWNGMVRIPALPFRQGLRFRSHTEKECSASECSLVCHDLLRLGYNHFVMDPGVRVAYNPVIANILYSGCVFKMESTPWKDIKSQHIQRGAYSVSDTTACCELKHNETFVDFHKNCFLYNPTSTNFTKIAIDMQFQPSEHSAFIQ